MAGRGSWWHSYLTTWKQAHIGRTHAPVTTADDPLHAAVQRQQQHCANLQVIANVEAEKRQGPCSSLLASGHRNSTRVFGQGGPARRAPADHPAHNSSFRVRPLPPAGDTAGRPRAPWPRFSGAIANQRRDTPRCARPRSACRAGAWGSAALESRRAGQTPADLHTGSAFGGRCSQIACRCRRQSCRCVEGGGF